MNTTFIVRPSFNPTHSHLACVDSSLGQRLKNGESCVNSFLSPETTNKQCIACQPNEAAKPWRITLTTISQQEKETQMAQIMPKKIMQQAIDKIFPQEDGSNKTTIKAMKMDIVMISALLKNTFRSSVQYADEPFLHRDDRPNLLFAQCRCTASRGVDVSNAELQVALSHYSSLVRQYLSYYDGQYENECLFDTNLPKLTSFLRVLFGSNMTLEVMRKLRFEALYEITKEGLAPSSHQSCVALTRD